MADVITIDRAGRVVIPAAVRRELALAPGTELEIELEGDSIRLRPIGGARLRRRGRVLIISSPLAGEVPDHRDLREDRVESLTPDK